MSIESKHAYRFGFLKSEEWKGIRLQALTRAGAACKICGRVDWSNDAHHRHYKRPWAKTRVGTLAILCRPCHELVHDLMKCYPANTYDSLIKSVRKDREMFQWIALNWRNNPENPPTGDGFEVAKADRGAFFSVCNRMGYLLTASRQQE